MAVFRRAMPYVPLLVQVLAAFSCLALAGVQAGQILGIETCVTTPPAGPSALNHVDLENLNMGKSYTVFETALARKEVGGNGKHLKVKEGQGTPVKQPLTGQTAKRKDLLHVLEHIIPAEFGMGKCKTDKPCDVGWKDVNKRQRNIVYISSLVDLKPFRKRIYIDGGSREYDSSIGSWFKSVYPQADLFDTIYAFDIGKGFAESYADKPGCIFVPCAMSNKDETLTMFGDSMNTIRGSAWVAKESKTRSKAYAINFSNWLHATVSPEDFVVVKLDIEGAEHELLAHLLETGAIYLIDELFVE